MPRLVAGLLMAAAWMALAPVVAAQGVALLIVDENSQPVEGAQGQVSDLLGTSGSDGMLYILGLAPGRYQLTVRLHGYHPDLRNVVVTAGQPTRLIVKLHRAVQGLPVEVETSPRPGFHGVVRDTRGQPLAGAEVHLLGRQGRVLRTEGDGRFDHATAGGAYLIRVTARGFQERRFSVSVPDSAGQEALIQLRVIDEGYEETKNAEVILLRQLGRRLAVMRPEHRLLRADLEEYGFRSLCTIPRLEALLRRAAGTELSGYEDGRLLVNVCTFRANAVELVEIGDRIIVWTPR